MTKQTKHKHNTPQIKRKTKNQSKTKLKTKQNKTKVLKTTNNPLVISADSHELRHTL